MHLIRQLPDAADCKTAVAIGNFDGLHRGHKAVIAAMQQAAKAGGLVPSVLTFEPHPRRFFKKDSPDFRIERLSDKLRRLAQAGVERVYMPRFDAAFASMSAPVFLDQVMRRQLGACAVVTGENFVFGHKRGGDCAMLKHWGERNQVAVMTVPPVMVGHEICSSSTIRAEIMQGNLAHVKTLLGHPYRLSGRVIHGEKRGRSIGFPTANIALQPGLLLPKFGVYAVRVLMDGKAFSGVVNLGIRPTVAVDNRPLLEVYVFDVVQDMYGKKLQVELVDKIRDEMKFDGIELLKEQIAKDCIVARSVLAGAA